MASLSPSSAFPDWKPEPRYVATQAEWKRIREHFKNECCVSCSHQTDHLHHIAFKNADRGGDVIENLAPMCTTCHDRFHGRRPGWEQVAAKVRQYVIVDNHRRQYAENMLGEKFGRRYPPLANNDPQFQSDFNRIYGVAS